MSLLFTIAAFAVALGLLIVVHELGHYFAARACGVKVLRFSVGFGRPWLSRRWGRDATEWVIAAFPLGGYVKMVDEREGEVKPEELHRAFNRQSVYRRSVIAVAGPAANLLLAILLYWLLMVYGMPGLKPVLGAPPAGTPAALAGFSEGETMAAIDGRPVATWQDARWVLLEDAMQKKAVRVETRNERGEIAWHELDLSGLTSADLDSDFLKTLGLARFQPVLAPVIGQVMRGGVAEQSGLKAGDEILAIDGREVTRWDELVEEVRSHPGVELQIEIKHADGKTDVIRLIPQAVREEGVQTGRIGAAPAVDEAAMRQFMTEVRYPPAGALLKALAKTWDTALFSLKMLQKMVVGEVSLKNLSGPITIADYAGQSAQIGLAAYLNFLALISISLGVLNLLPIPLLDGGHLMYYMLEILRGKPVSDRVMEIGQNVGIALLFLLMALAIYNDISRLIGG